jgi:class 3 adenylate cyclase
LGDVAADGVRRAHFGLLRKAFASHGREEVESVGDGVMAVFGSWRGRLRATPRCGMPPFVTTMASSAD